ncbi:hypothetical protein R6K75_10575 [Enterococcus faecium]|uniref:hypothetical protein n=1 Tax=Enterococcus faecium TaxID=1352 RepID=UPI00296AD1FF|nr:hypothetical protein [Enterococcus faecium]MDW3620042.1 hypothetical protein [Enterococcus faecium]
MKKTLSIHLLKNAIQILLFLILFFPTIFQNIKLVLIIFILFMYLVIPVNKIRVKYSILIWLLAYLLTNFFYLTLGSIRNNQVFNILSSVYLLWPILYFLVFIFPLSLEDIKFDIFKFCSKVGLIISIFTIYIYLSYRGVLPEITVIDSIFPHSINSYGGYVSYFSPNITSFFFLIPIVIISVFNKKQNEYIILNIISLFSMVLSSLLIGRRALILSIGIVLIIYICIKIYIGEIKLIKVIKFLLIFIVGYFLIYYILSFFNLNLRIFNLELISQLSDGERNNQFVDLINSWKNKPIIGVGYGINSEHVIRSFTVPGTYELSYVALLFQTGIVGVLVYGILYLWLAFRTLLLFFKSKNIEYLAMFLSYVSIMIAHGTNPYITSFDGAWIMFFLLASINRYPHSLNGKGDISDK